MGRPLNKKYFGNRNIGTNGAQDINFSAFGPAGSDDEIGGEGVASYGSIVAGSGWTTNPDPYFSDPSIPGGVTVQGIVHYKALSFATTSNGTGYAVGDVLEVNTGTAATKARAPVASITVVNTPNISSGGGNYDWNGSIGDQVTFLHANFSTPLTVMVTSVNDPGGHAATISVVNSGVWIGSGAPPTSMADGVGGFTATTHDGPLDTNGAGLTLNGFSWGVYAFGAVSVAGDYTEFPDVATSLGAVTGTGMNAHATITMGLLSVAVTQKGSGYVDAADAELLFDNGANGASATAVLTTDSGSAGSATNQENAIIIHANTGDGTEIGDIQKQTNDRRYRVRTNNATRVCDLVTTDDLDIGEAYIKATDNEGSTYFVYKLTAHKAVLVQWDQGLSPFLFETGDAAKWSFTVNADDTVIIENA